MGDQRALAVEHAFLFPINGLRHDALGGLHGQRAVFDNGARQFQRAGQRAARFGQAVDQAKRIRAFGGQHFARQDHFHGDVVRQAARQAQHAAGARHQAALDFGQAELGVAGGHDQVGRQGHFAATGQRVAFHGGDQRLLGRAFVQAGETTAFNIGALPGFGECLQVHARRERAAATRQDADADVVAAIQLVQRGGHGLGGFQVDGVLGFGAVDRDDLDAVGDFHRDQV
ncbi:hypothetical protein D3C73_868830 [compost metagenome]